MGDAELLPVEVVHQNCFRCIQVSHRACGDVPRAAHYLPGFARTPTAGLLGQFADIEADYLYALVASLVTLPTRKSRDVLLRGGDAGSCPNLVELAFGKW